LSEDTYDPNAPEGVSQGKSQHLSAKDARVIAVASGLFVLIMIPVFLYGKRNSEKAVCIRNMASIYKAMEFYALDRDDRLPVAYYTLDFETPVQTPSGLPRTWASDIAPYMSKRASFACPSAGANEASLVDGNTAWDEGNPIRLTYGMYVAYSSALRSNIENPDSVVLLAETANGGANNTYDPLPLTPSDGYAIGWSDSNAFPSTETRFVTRLAFPGSAGPNFQEKGAGRHDIGIHAITAVGARLNLTPDRAKVQIGRGTGLPEGLWATPPGLRRIKLVR
jgi:hypothetical protein